MQNYIIKRLLLMIPTLLGIMVINFAIIQLAPGGPVERALAAVSGVHAGATNTIAGSGSSDFALSQNPGVQPANITSQYRGSRGVDAELIKRLEAQFGFDKPIHERFLKMLSDYASLDFGTSFFRDVAVIDLIAEKLPVSISLGLWTTLLVYLISIPLGIKKAVRDGSGFDIATSWVVIIGYAIPSFLFAILLVVLFAGGSFMSIFPISGIVSDDFSSMPWYSQILDYLWHMVLPVTALVIGGFASLTMLTKNLFIEEISKQYVLTARAKGLSEKRVLYGHVFRNAMLIIISGFPAAFIGILFTGALLIEIIFSLDGLGLLAYESARGRDFPVIFASLFIFTIIGLVLTLISDIVYTLVDPRIDFEKREI